MNERIQELAQEAAHLTRVTHNNAYWRMMDEVPEDKAWREKFAELIVNECTEIGSQWADGLIDSKHYTFVSKKIKQYFGVE